MKPEDARTIDAVKDELEARLASHPSFAPGKVGALNVPDLVDRIDGVLQRYVPLLGPLAPPQVAAVVALIEAGVHLGNQALHGQPVVNPFNPPL